MLQKKIKVGRFLPGIGLYIRWGEGKKITENILESIYWLCHLLLGNLGQLP